MNKEKIMVFLLKGIVIFFSMNIQILAAQEKEYEALELKKQPVRAGQTIQIKFDIAKAGVSKSETPIYAVMFSYKSGNVSAVDTLMTGKSKLTAKFNVPDSADAIAFKFIQGLQEYTNNGNGYYYSVNDKNGNAQIGTKYSLYRLNSNDYLVGITKGRAELAKKYYNEWFADQDLEKMSYYEKAIALYIRKDTSALIKHFSLISSSEDLTEGQFQNLGLYTRLAGKLSANLIEKEKEKRFPRGKWYWQPWLDSLKKLETIPEKLVWIKAFQFVYPDVSATEHTITYEMYVDIIRTAVRTNDLQSLLLYSSLLKSKNYSDERLNYYNIEFAKNLIKKDTLLNDAYQLLNKPLSFFDTKIKSFASIQNYQSKQMYLLEANRQYMEIASLFGELLYKMERYDSAFYYTGAAANFEDLNKPVYNERYFLAMEKIKGAQYVIDALKPVFRGKGYNYKMQEQFLRLYKNTFKNDGVLVLDELLNDTKLKTREEVKSKMINEPAPDFLLPGLKGGNISSASLKGKVVVLDFWATWCGPCVAAFPAMQQLVNANKSDSSVRIYFVDTWQKETDKYANAEKFFTDKPYKLDVYMDTEDKAVKDFKVQGIPTKVIIDKSGVIRFISIGFAGDEQRAVEELQAMIDIAAMQ